MCLDSTPRWRVSRRSSSLNSCGCRSRRVRQASACSCRSPAGRTGHTRARSGSDRRWARNSRGRRPGPPWQITTGVFSAPGSRSPTTRYHVSCPSHTIRPSPVLISLSFVVVGRRWRRACERRRSAKWVMACRKASAAEGGKRRPSGRYGRVATERGLEPTSRRRVNRAWYLSLEHDPAPRRWRAVPGVDEWDRGEERLGVRMNRALVEDVHRRLLDDHAEVHDGDPVRTWRTHRDRAR